MKKIVLATAIVFAATGAFAQTTTAVKEAAKATGEKVMEGKENAQAAVTKEPAKSAHKAKAAKHAASSAKHDAAASAAGAKIGK